MEIAAQTTPAPPASYVFADRSGGSRSGDGGRRAEALRLGLWLFLGTVTMLFAAFASAYIVRRGGSDWTRVTLPTGLWLNTAVLALSSAALETSSAAGRRRRWPAATGMLAAAIGLGVAFLGGQVLVWQGLRAAGVFLPTNPHSAFFYLLTGTHAVHVVAALVVLAAAMKLTISGHGRHDLPRWLLTMDLVRTFWHFLFGVWLFVFALISVW